MKKLLTFILLLFASSAFANSAQLAWDASPSLTTEACVEECGYIVYYGPDQTDFTFNKPVGNVLTTEITDLPPGEAFFAVSAYTYTEVDGFQESVKSNVVSAVYEVDPIPAPVVHEPYVVEVPAGTTLTINVIVE